MNWKFSGDRPVYQQIMENIRGAILRGELSPGGKIPSVRDLAAEAQVNPNTMESKLVPGLFLCGELLDIDGMCGGYNLQWAWSSGYVAGSHAG